MKKKKKNQKCMKENAKEETAIQEVDKWTAETLRLDLK